MSYPLQKYSRKPHISPRILRFSRYSLGLNGLSNWVRVLHDASLNITSQGTLSLWFMPRELGRTQHLFAKADAYDMYLFWDDNRIYVRKIAPSPPERAFSDPLTPADLYRWIYIVGVFDHVSENKVKLYINGVLVNQADLTTDVATSTADLGIGAWSNGSTDFVNGLIDMPMIYTVALSQSEIRHNMIDYLNPIRDNLVLWLALEEGTGLTAYDKSGCGNDGDLLPAASPPAWRRNKMWGLRAEVGI